MDLASNGAEFVIEARPVGFAGVPHHGPAKHGYLAQIDGSEAKVMGDTVYAGMNDGGLSCDLNALIFPYTKYPGNSTTLDNIGVGGLCQWALGGFASVSDLKQGL